MQSPKSTTPQIMSGLAAEEKNKDQKEAKLPTSPFVFLPTDEVTDVMKISYLIKIAENLIAILKISDKDERAKRIKDLPTLVDHLESDDLHGKILGLMGLEGYPVYMPGMCVGIVSGLNEAFFSNEIEIATNRLDFLDQYLLHFKYDAAFATLKEIINKMSGSQELKETTSAQLLVDAEKLLRNLNQGLSIDKKNLNPDESAEYQDYSVDMSAFTDRILQYMRPDLFRLSNEELFQLDTQKVARTIHSRQLENKVAEQALLSGNAKNIFYLASKYLSPWLKKANTTLWKLIESKDPTAIATFVDKTSLDLAVKSLMKKKLEQLNLESLQLDAMFAEEPDFESPLNKVHTHLAVFDSDDTLNQFLTKLDEIARRRNCPDFSIIVDEMGHRAMICRKGAADEESSWKLLEANRLRLLKKDFTPSELPEEVRESFAENVEGQQGKRVLALSYQTLPGGYQTLQKTLQELAESKLYQQVTNFAGISKISYVSHGDQEKKQVALAEMAGAFEDIACIEKLIREKLESKDQDRFEKIVEIMFQALVSSAIKNRTKVIDFLLEPGKGLTARHDGKRVLDNNNMYYLFTNAFEWLCQKIPTTNTLQNTLTMLLIKGLPLIPQGFQKTLLKTLIVETIECPSTSNQDRSVVIDILMTHGVLQLPPTECQELLKLAIDTALKNFDKAGVPKVFAVLLQHLSFIFRDEKKVQSYCREKLLNTLKSGNAPPQMIMDLLNATLKRCSEAEKINLLKEVLFKAVIYKRVEYAKEIINYLGQLSQDSDKIKVLEIAMRGLIKSTDFEGKEALLIAYMEGLKLIGSAVDRLDFFLDVVTYAINQNNILSINLILSKIEQFFEKNQDKEYLINQFLKNENITDDIRDVLIQAKNKNTTSSNDAITTADSTIFKTNPAAAEDVTEIKNVPPRAKG
jgi:hypothetical protein